MTSLPEQGNLQTNAVAPTPQPNIATLVGQIQQRRAQGVRRQPPGTPSDPKAAPAPPPVRSSGPVPIPPPARSPGPPQQTPSPAPAPPDPAVAPAPASAVAPAPTPAPTPAPASVSGPTPPPDHGKYANLPPALRQTGRFCGWRYEERGSGKPAKVPYNMATGERASVADPASFVSFAEAMRCLTPEHNGIGVRIADGICALDLDHVIDQGGNPSPEAKDIILRMDCYTEVSPSGRGYRLLFTVRPDFHFDSNTYYINNQACGIEVYVAGATEKYVTVTGDTITPGVDLLDRTDQLRDVLDRYFRRPAPAPPQAAAAVPQPGNQPQDLLPEDQQLLDAIRQSASGELFDRLWAGNMDDYCNDHSRADLALANILAARTADMAQIDRVFRHSGLMRQKWDERRGNRNYGEITVAKALASAPRQGQQSAQAAPTSQQPVQSSPPTPATQPSQAIQQPGQQAPPASQQGQAGQPAQRRGPIPAKVLMQLRLPPTKYYVDGLIPEGLTLLASAPKSGKSLLCTDLCVSITSSTPFLGLSTTPSGVLYLALEDTEKRLQKRLTTILDGRPVPNELYFETEAPDMRHGLFDMLDAYIRQHPAISLIIVDTLQLVRGCGVSPDIYSYSQDYQDLVALKQYADSRHVGIIMVHHTRKAGDGDIFSTVSGTQGIAGAVDTTMVLSRQRNTDEAVLAITGRDVDEREISIRLDKESLRWRSLGDAQALREERERQKFLCDPLVQTVQELLDQSPDHSWCGQASELVAASAASHRDVGNAQSVGYALAKNANNFLTHLGISYFGKKNGTNGKVHCFEALPLDPES